jgi:hypothetical protein
MVRASPPFLHALKMARQADLFKKYNKLKINGLRIKARELIGPPDKSEAALHDEVRLTYIFPT